MRLRRTLLAAALAAALFGSPVRAQEPVDWVDPFIGTTNFGTTNPGAVTPNGMMAVVPFNVMGSDTNRYDTDARWWSTPYEYHNKFFTGFAHGALSGVGCPEMGSLLTMATTGELTVAHLQQVADLVDFQNRHPAKHVAMPFHIGDILADLPHDFEYLLRVFHNV